MFGLGKGSACDPIASTENFVLPQRVDTYTVLTSNRQQARDWSIVRIQPNAEREAYRQVLQAVDARMRVIACHVLCIPLWRIWVIIIRQAQ